VDSLIKLFRVSRPISWVNTAFPFAAGYLVLGGEINATLIVATLFFLIPYNLLMYGVNDVFDYESDIRNPRKGSIEGAVEAKQFHPTILWASALTTIPFVIALFYLLPLASFMTMIIVLFFVIAYSLKGLRFKEIPFLDSITSSIHFVGPLVVAAACFSFPGAAWVVIIAFFLWGMASHAFGAVQDIIPDREGGLRSIATVIGARATVRLSVWLYLVSCVLIFQTGIVGIIIAIAGLLYVAITAPYFYVTDKTSGKTNVGWRRFIWVNYFVGAVVTISLVAMTVVVAK